MKSRAAFDMTCLRTSKGWNRLDAIRKFYAHDPALSGMVINTARDAKEFLERAEKLRHLSRLRGVEVLSIHVKVVYILPSST